MTTDCINLKEAFGDRYRVAHEESYQADYGEGAIRVDPWGMVILCQYGHICPWGGNRLAACTDHPGIITNRLLALPFIDREASQHGDDGINAVFDVEHFEEVARIMRPRKRRRLSEEQKRRLAEASREYRFTSGAQPRESTRECDPAAAVV